jgi:hypothetical protein
MLFTKYIRREITTKINNVRLTSVTKYTLYLSNYIYKLQNGYVLLKQHVQVLFNHIPLCLMMKLNEGILIISKSID